MASFAAMNLLSAFSAFVAVRSIVSTFVAVTTVVVLTVDVAIGFCPFVFQQAGLLVDSTIISGAFVKEASFGVFLQKVL
jgi:hypothetical protein